MWRDKRSNVVLHAYLGPESLRFGLLKGSGKTKIWILEPQEISLPIVSGAKVPTLDSLSPAICHAREILDAHGRGPVRAHIVASDVWLLHLTLPWIEGIEHGKLEKVASEILHDLGYERDQLDAVRIDDANFGKPRALISYPQILVTQLQELIGSDRPLSISSCGAVMLSQLRPEGQIQELLIKERGAYTLLYADQNRRILKVQSKWAVEKNERSVEDVSCRLKIRRPQLASATRVRVDVDDFSIAEIKPNHPFDLHLSQPIAFRWQRALIGLLLLISIYLGYDLSRSFYELKKIEAKNYISSETKISDSRIGLSQERLSAINEAIRHLNVPVNSLLKGAKPPKDISITINSVEFQGEKTNGLRVAKISGDAASSNDLTRYVAYLGSKHPFVDAILTRHEQQEVGYGMRFSVEASWED